MIYKESVMSCSQQSFREPNLFGHVYGKDPSLNSDGYGICLACRCKENTDATVVPCTGTMLGRKLAKLANMLHMACDRLDDGTAWADESKEFYEMKRMLKYHQTPRQFFKLTERNEWENETWHFYIPINGNEKARDLIVKYIEESLEPDLEIDEELLPESTVDILVQYSDSGYLSYHNKVDGFLDLEVVKEELALEAPFYKGGVMDCVTSVKNDLKVL